MGLAGGSVNINLDPLAIAGSFRRGGSFGPGDAPSHNQDMWNQIAYDTHLADRRADEAYDQLKFQQMKEYMNRNLSYQYKQAKEAGLDPSLVHGAPGYNPAPLSSGRSFKPFADQNTTRAARAQGLMAAAHIEARTKAELEKTEAEGELVKAQAALAREQVRKSQSIPLTTMIYRTPDGRYITAPTPEYAGSMIGRPLSNIGENIDEAYGLDGDSMRYLHRQPDHRKHYQNSPRTGQQGTLLRSTMKPYPGQR